eukprot:7937270-Heterocapsa_arctica.AAC.1
MGASPPGWRSCRVLGLVQAAFGLALVVRSINLCGFRWIMMVLPGAWSQASTASWTIAMIANPPWV